jgi:transposase
MLYVGLDYHTRQSQVAILDEHGQVVMEGRLETEWGLPKLLRDLPDEAKVLFEAGYGWPRLVRILEGIPVELVMCHPVENRKIACDRRKSDKRDARNLAVYLMTGTYKEVYMSPEDVRTQRQLVRSRACISRHVTMAKNGIHGLLGYAGIPKQTGDIFAKKRREFLENVELPEEVREILNIDLKLLDVQDELMGELDKRIVRMNRNDPTARLLKTIPGVGDFTARMIIAQVGDIRRFPSDKAFACYCGLTPGQRQSSDTVRMMGISKEGSSMLRWCLVQSSWIAIRMDPSLRQFFESLQSRKDSCTAICAVARKLAVAVWHIMTKQVPYRARKPKSEGKPAVPLGKSERKP